VAFKITRNARKKSRLIVSYGYKVTENALAFSPRSRSTRDSSEFIGVQHSAFFTAARQYRELCRRLKAKAREGRVVEGCGLNVEAF